MTGSSPFAFERAAWVSPDDILWVGISDFVRKALVFADCRPLTAPAGFTSVIVANSPALYAEFGGKRFALLWRGSRNGFHARLSRPLRRSRAHSDTDPGHEWGLFRGFTPVAARTEFNS
jgi:hypothetical protein